MNFCRPRTITDDVAGFTTFYEVVIGTTVTGNDSYREVTTTGSPFAIKRLPDAGHHDPSIERHSSTSRSRDAQSQLPLTVA
jgi:hypothetical protein